MRCFGERRENNLLWHLPFHLNRENHIDLFIGFDLSTGELMG